MSIREIWKESGVFPITIKNNIPKLKKEGLIIEQKEGKRSFYKFNYKKIGEKE